MAEIATRQKQEEPQLHISKPRRQDAFLPGRQYENTHVGEGICDLENAVLNLGEKQLSGLKMDYCEFVSLRAGRLRASGIANPAGIGQAIDICRRVHGMVWRGEGKFSPIASIGLLLEGLQNKTLDCDTSAFVFGDILSQFGLKIGLVAVYSEKGKTNHVLLSVEVNGKEKFYLETTSPNSPVPKTYTPQEFRAAYPLVYGEYEFKAENPTVLLSIADSLFEKGEFAKAFEYYDRAIRLDRKNASSFMGRGIACFNSKMDDEAFKDFGTAIELAPSSINVRLHRAKAYSLRMRHNEALSDYNEAIKIAEKPACIYAAGIKVRMPQGKESACLYAERAGILANLKRFSDAVKDMERAIELDPENKHYSTRLGELRKMK